MGMPLPRRPHGERGHLGTRRGRELRLTGEEEREPWPTLPEWHDRMAAGNRGKHIAPRLMFPRGLAMRGNRLCGVGPSPLAAMALA
jgi:hypothetical protein